MTRKICRPFSKVRSGVEGAGILTLAVIVATRIPRIVNVWGIVGSTLASLAIFVLPAFFFLKLQRGRNQKAYNALALLVFGVVMCVACTVDSIMDIVYGAPTN